MYKKNIKNILFIIFTICCSASLVAIFENQNKALQELQDIVMRLRSGICDPSTVCYPSIFDYHIMSKHDRDELTKISKSQPGLKQDIFVYLELNKKKNGYFVEFGAADGILFSNSYMLENNFGWRGILAEPGLSWHKNLYINRPLAAIDTNCVWKENGAKIIFNETTKPELSTLKEYFVGTNHSEFMDIKKQYEVNTITLLSLLQKHNAPEEIDYLSIDTEGSEYDILEEFFKSNTHYKIKIITCEHNYTENRDKIYNLLTKNGYERKYQDASLWDDFYVLKSQNHK